VMGFADLDAAIEIDGVSRSEHQSMRLDRG
jgi:hypothetical protein